MIKLSVNGTSYEVDVDPDTPLLWVIRDNLGLTGTKFGCGIARCGVCIIHRDGRPIRSCVTPVASATGSNITTIEGIASDGQLHPVQQAWIDLQVPQCGYCQSGQIMSAIALLNNIPSPTEQDIDSAMAGVICRCGMYSRIKKGIQRVASAEVQIFDPSVGTEVQHG